MTLPSSAAAVVGKTGRVPDDKPDKSLWTRKVEADPEHSRWFLQRFRDMRAAGQDIAGEARFVDAMAPRGARIFDAGCGSGRTGGPLAALGHTVIGVDVDPVLIDAARQDFPDATWLAGDLAELDPADPALGGPFDLAVAAGNVLPFLAPSTRRTVLANIRAVLKAGGRAAVGFGAGRGYPFDEFFADAAATGWTVEVSLRGWNLLPFDAESEFLVAVMAASAPGRATAPSATFARLRPLGDAGSDPMGGHSLRPMHG
jgi:SAM-dependent methyltransferase